MTKICRKFSVIIPAYNSEETILSAIESVENQTYDNWELIIVNDGSADTTLEICNDKEKADKRIRVFTIGNSGVSIARNTGIKFATGEYIVFLDSDDQLQPCCLITYNRILEAENYDLIISNYIEFNHDTEFTAGRIIENIICKEQMDQLLTILVSQSQYKKELWYGNLRTVWGKCWRKQAISDANVEFNKELKIGEDMCFLLQFLLNCTRVATSNIQTYKYNIGNISVMRSYSWSGPNQGNVYIDAVYRILGEDVKKYNAIDLVTEVLENESTSLHRVSLSFSRRYHEFRKLLITRSKDYKRAYFNDKCLLSTKQKIYRFCLQERLVLLFMLVTKMRYLKNNKR